MKDANCIDKCEVLTFVSTKSKEIFIFVNSIAQQ